MGISLNFSSSFSVPCWNLEPWVFKMGVRKQNLACTLLNYMGIINTCLGHPLKKKKKKVEHLKETYQWSLNFFLSSPEDKLINFRERRREGEWEGEKHQSLPLIHCQQGAESSAFRFTGQCSNQLSHTGQGSDRLIFYWKQLVCLLEIFRFFPGFIFLPFVAKAERTGSYASSCRGMEEKGPRERITRKEKGTILYRNWRRKERMLMIVSCVYIFEIVCVLSLGKRFKVICYILGGWVYYSGRKTSKNPNWFREARAAACQYRIRGTVFVYQIFF